MCLLFYYSTTNYANSSCAVLPSRPSAGRVDNLGTNPRRFRRGCRRAINPLRIMGFKTGRQKVVEFCLPDTLRRHDPGYLAMSSNKAQNSVQTFCTELICTFSSGECAPLIFGPKLTMSRSG